MDTASPDPVPPERESALAPGVLDDLIGYHLRRASGVVAADFGRALAGTGVRQVPFAVAAMVAANPGTNQGAVGRALGIKRANMVALVNELTDAGVVERRPAMGNRRAFALSLSAAGRVMFEEWMSRILAHEDGLFSTFTPDERATLTALLRRLGG